MINLIKRVGVPIVMVSALALPTSSLAGNSDTTKVDDKNSISVFYHNDPETTTPSFMKLDFSRKVGELWRLDMSSEYLDRNRNASFPLSVDMSNKIKLNLDTYFGPSIHVKGIGLSGGLGLDFKTVYYKLNKSDVDLFYKFGLELPIKSGYKFYFYTKDNFLEKQESKFGIGLKVNF